MCVYLCICMYVCASDPVLGDAQGTVKLFLHFTRDLDDMKEDVYSRVKVPADPCVCVCVTTVRRCPSWPLCVDACGCV